MAKRLAFLEYTFVFEPSVSTWQTGFSFEKDIYDFLASNSLEAEIVDTVGGSSRRIIYVQSMNKLDKIVNDTPPKGIQSSLQNTMRKAMEVGKNGKS